MDFPTAVELEDPKSGIKRGDLVRAEYTGTGDTPFLAMEYTAGGDGDTRGLRHLPYRFTVLNRPVQVGALYQNTESGQIYLRLSHGWEVLNGTKWEKTRSVWDNFIHESKRFEKMGTFTK